MDPDRWLTAALIDVADLADELNVSWNELDREINRQLDEANLGEWREADLLEATVWEWLVTGHLATLHLNLQHFGLGDFRVCYATINGLPKILGFMREGRLYRVRSFEALWERYLDALRLEEGDLGGQPS